MISVCVNLQYLVNDVVDVVVHFCFGVKCKVSLPVILESFEEEMSECHQVILFKRRHHFIAQAKRD